MAHQKLTVAYNGNVAGQANTYSYSGSFDVFKGTEVVALLDNVKLTYTASTINESASPREYTVDTIAKTIHIGGADLSSGVIIIRPETDVKGSDAPTPRATYTPGSSIASDDLNNNQLQLLRKAIEYEDQKLSSTGGTMTGDLTMGEDTKIIFEGATDDDYETTLTVVDPTADRTITLPNVTGTVVTTGDTATVTATMLAANSVDSSELVDGSVDLSHMSANSVDSAQYVDGSIDHEHLANDIIDGDNIQDDVINSEHIAAGAIDLEHMASSSVDSDNIVNDTIVNADINSSAAIAHSKLANVTSGQILVGNGSNVPTAVAVSGDVTLSNAGAVTIATGAVEHAMLAGDCIDGDNIQDDVINSEHYAAGSIDHEHLANDIIDGDNIANDAVSSEHIVDGAIVNAAIANDAAIAHSKLANITDGQILVGSGSNVPTAVAVSGDVTIANTGAVTIANDAVEIGMIGCEQTTISDSDSHIPTSGAVVDYVAAQLAPIGGLEVIADDESFPNTIPAAGVVISITDAAGLQVNSSGVSTNGDSLDNSTITINGFPSELRGGVGSNADPYVFQSGAGLMVQSTGSSQTYNYHQALIRESDFVQLSDDINDFNNRYRVAAAASGVRTGQCGADGTGSGSYPCDGDMAWFTGANKMYVFDAPAASTSNSDLDAAWKEVTSTGDYKILTIQNNGGAAGDAGPTFNDSNDQFDLFDGSADASITNAQQLIVVLNGVIQKPNASWAADGEGFALDGSDGIRFCDPPPSDSVCFVTQIGTATTISTPGTGSISNANMFAAGVINAAAIGTGAVEHAKLGADCVDGDNIADNSIGLEHLAGGTDGNLITYNASGDPAHVAAGNDGQVLTSQGAGSVPQFEDLPASGPSLTGSTNNTVVTVTGANAMAGEANLHFDGTRLLVGSDTSTRDEAKVQVFGTADTNYIAMENTSASDSDGARYGKIIYRGTQSGGEKTDLVHLVAAHDGSADDQKGQFIVKINDGSDGNSPTERFKVSNAGNVTVSDGDLVIGTAGHGVDFSATANAGTTGSSMTSELLDWYEEGSWTPSITFGGTSNFVGGVHNVQWGTYTRVGRLVTASGTIGYSDKGSSSGLVNINGLPFTSGGSTHRCGGWANYSSFFSTETDNSTVQLYLGDSRTNMETLHDSQDNLNASDCNSAGQMNFTVLYQV